MAKWDDWDDEDAIRHMEPSRIPVPPYVPFQYHDEYRRQYAEQMRERRPGLLFIAAYLAFIAACTFIGVWLLS